MVPSVFSSDELFLILLKVLIVLVIPSYIRTFGVLGHYHPYVVGWPEFLSLKLE
jgi:hypothetical protein